MSSLRGAGPGAAIGGGGWRGAAARRGALVPGLTFIRRTALALSLGSALALGLLVSPRPEAARGGLAGASPRWAAAAPVMLSILAHPADSKNENFRLQVTGFSVAALPDVYRVYGTAGFQQLKWNRGQTAVENLYHLTAPFPDGGGSQGRGDCAHSKDPRLCDARCSTDAVGYFWMRVGCPPTGAVACQDNDRWNASPGRYNLTAFPAPGVWPRADDFGMTNYAPVVDHVKVNAASSGRRRYHIIFYKDKAPVSVW